MAVMPKKLIRRQLEQVEASPNLPQFWTYALAENAVDSYAVGRLLSYFR
jgi:hypothetical protein